MSVETRVQKDKARFEHIVDELMGLDPDTDPLFLALQDEGIERYSDLVDLVLDHDRIDDLEYPFRTQDKDGNEVVVMKQLAKMHKRRLEAFCRVNSYFKAYHKDTPGLSDDEFEIREVTSKMYDDGSGR